MGIVGEVETADPLTPRTACPRCDVLALQWTEGVAGGLWCSACDTFYTPADDDEAVSPYVELRAVARLGLWLLGPRRRLLQRRRELIRVLRRRRSQLGRALRTAK